MRRTIHKPRNSIFWAVIKDDKIHIGETAPGQRTDSGLGHMIEANTIDILISKLTPYILLLGRRPPEDKFLIPDRIYNDRGIIKAPLRRPR